MELEGPEANEATGVELMLPTLFLLVLLRARALESSLADPIEELDELAAAPPPADDDEKLEPS